MLPAPKVTVDEYKPVSVVVMILIPSQIVGRDQPVPLAVSASCPCD
jgi:hypothetical protein